MQTGIGALDDRQQSVEGEGDDGCAGAQSAQWDQKHQQSEGRNCLDHSNQTQHPAAWPLIRVAGNAQRQAQQCGERHSRRHHTQVLGGGPQQALAPRLRCRSALASQPVGRNLPLALTVETRPAVQAPHGLIIQTTF